MKEKPYAVGLNGHAKKCDCRLCAKARAKLFKLTLRRMKLFDETMVKPPTSADQTVFVRAHLKRTPNHLRRFPHTRTLMRRALKGVL